MSILIVLLYHVHKEGLYEWPPCSKYIPVHIFSCVCMFEGSRKKMDKFMSIFWPTCNTYIKANFTHSSGDKIACVYIYWLWTLEISNHKRIFLYTNYGPPPLWASKSWEFNTGLQIESVLFFRKFVWNFCNSYISVRGI